MGMKGLLETLTGHLRHHLSPAILVYWILLLGGLYLFVKLIKGIHVGQGFLLDEPILVFLAVHRTEALDYFFRSITWLGSNYIIIPIGITLFITLLRFGYFSEAILLSLGYGGAVLITYITKFIIARHRPELFPHLTETYLDSSFPSGHATQITAFALSLFLIVRQLKSHWQVSVGIIAIMSIAAVGSSRIYLQVHYPSDVLAGISVATSWVLSVNGLLRWQQNRKVNR